MVDRYKSLVDSQIIAEQRKPAHFERNAHRELVERMNTHATKMRQYIRKYKMNTGPEETFILEQFNQQQKLLAKDRNSLKLELEGLERKKMKDSPEYNFMKGELLRAVKSQINLELELDQEITKRKQQKEQLARQLISSSPKLANALRDIEAKREEILFLEKQINECIELLEIIGILAFEQGQKIDLIAEQVRNANRNIERAEANIEKAKINMERSRCRMCCIIILALVAICLILAVLFGFNIVNL